MSKEEESLFFRKNSYKAKDFFGFQDKFFLRNVYYAVLGREPDPQGMQYYLEQLRSGKFNKIDILGRLRYSPEGRNKQTKITGLLLPFALNTIYKKIPVFGYVLNWIFLLFQLPTVLNKIQAIEGETYQHLTEMRENLNQLSGKIDRIEHFSYSKADNKSLEEIKNLIAEMRTGYKHP
jgi:O-antigen chain-terminating methyltransferase